MGLVVIIYLRIILLTISVSAGYLPLIVAVILTPTTLTFAEIVTHLPTTDLLQIYLAPSGDVSVGIGCNYLPQDNILASGGCPQNIISGGMMEFFKICVCCWSLNL